MPKSSIGVYDRLLLIIVRPHGFFDLLLALSVGFQKGIDGAEDIEISVCAILSSEEAHSAHSIICGAIPVTSVV